VVIRPATDGDREAIWAIFRAVIAGRDTYTFAPDTPHDVGVGYWFGPGITTFVAELDGRVVGMYKLVPNAMSLGAHVSNASFMVDPAAAGRGIGRALGTHALREARAQGYDAMQFNFVVSTNRRAIALWQGLGFRIVGTLPLAFRHGLLGLVDAYVMHRSLDDIVLTFGEERASDTAIVRPSAYAVLRGDLRGRQPTRIALVRAREDVLLPGGGLDPGEEHRAALLREVAEECALQIAITQALGEAVQFVGGRDGRPVTEKRNAFFGAEIAGTLEQEPEHAVLWLTPEDAVRAATNASHRWAITRWARLNT
jgi:ribosomal protein S18 acetylase RimI-like enzyme/8-oxo-dGTP pyrophosphatase MutT (NUDIX family)